MLRVLDALQLVQKDFKSSWGNNKFFDMMVYRVVVLTNVLGDCQLPGSVVVDQTLCNQERPMGKILRKVLAEIENQLLRRTAAIGLSDFLHNVRLDNFKGVCYMEGGEVHRLQLRG